MIPASQLLRWLPRVITNTLSKERKLEKETWLISLEVFPDDKKFTSMGTVKIRLMLCLSIFFGLRPLPWQHLI